MSRYLSVEDILRFHDVLIERYGGTKGVRDQSGLKSAVGDGNKRTAVAAAAAFLRMNGKELLIDDLVAYQWLIERYESSTMKKAVIETWLREHVRQL